MINVCANKNLRLLQHIGRIDLPPEVVIFLHICKIAIFVFLSMYRKFMFSLWWQEKSIYLTNSHHILMLKSYLKFLFFLLESWITFNFITFLTETYEFNYMFIYSFIVILSIMNCNNCKFLLSFIVIFWHIYCWVSLWRTLYLVMRKVIVKITGWKNIRIQ